MFCLSIWVTGSAWWALGCHASWDWAETVFYGTPDSGFVAKGHLFTSVAQGPALWSGGTDGPEGSVLVLPVILLLAVVLLSICYWALERVLQEERDKVHFHFSRLVGAIHEHEAFLSRIAQKSDNATQTRTRTQCPCNVSC